MDFEMIQIKRTLVEEGNPSINPTHKLSVWAYQLYYLVRNFSKPQMIVYHVEHN